MPRAKAEKAGGKRGARKVKKPKDKNAPKKPCTAFFFFVKHRRTIKADEGMKVSEFTKECGALWRGMDTEEKGKYEKQAVADKARYAEDMAVYAPGTLKGAADPNKPKRPATPFLLFANAQRKKLTEEGFNQKEVLQEAGRLWKEMDDDDKSEYTEAAEKEKKKYKKAMDEYNATGGGAASAAKKNGSPVKSKAPVESDDDDDDDDEEDDDVESDDE